MAELVIPKRFRDAQAISVADIDANFAAVDALLNTTKLGADNFRSFSGITNAQKTSPCSLVPIVVSVPKIELTPTAEADATASYSGLWAYPSFHQGKYDDVPGAPSDIGGGSKLPIYVASIQVVSHASVNRIAGDLVTASVYGRSATETSDKSLGAIPGTVDDAIATGVVASPLPVDFAYLKLSFKAVKSSILKRTFNNTFVTIWCKMPHVAAGR